MPAGARPVVLVHAGVADRRMWDPQWAELCATHEVLRLDLRGFGESVARPEGPLSPTADVVATLDDLGLRDCHLVGASFGAGVAVEVALTRPDLVASLLLVAPGGSLIAEMTPDLQAFVTAERAAMAEDDLTAAVEANLRWWADGPGRPAGAMPSGARALVAEMQQRAFELTSGWDDIEEDELAPPALDRLAEITVPTLVLHGVHDLDAIVAAAGAVVRDVASGTAVEWSDVAHLPSLEQPQRFLDLVRHWTTPDRRVPAPPTG